MNKPNLIHLPPSVGGTFITALPRQFRTSYEEAIRRYTGPARLVLCDQAYIGTEQEKARMRQCVALHRPCAVEYSRPLPHCFSVHCLNINELPQRSLEPFWRILDAINEEALHAQVGRQGTPTEEASAWFIGAFCACVVGVVLGLMLTGLCLYLFP